MDVDMLLSELTLQEKAALVIGKDFWHTRDVERLGLPSIMVSDGPHGMRTQLHVDVETNVGGSEPATCFPTASNVHAGWDREMVRRVGEAIAEEARALGVGVVLGPGVNIKRSPLCGRNFEYISEDPYLAGEMGLALVEGIQSRGVGTSLKHFAANNQETDRIRMSSDVDERTLREIYLPAFERIVTAAQPWTVMCSYNKINGVWASQNHWLLTEVLRDEWGFDGLVVSDWGAVADRVAAVKAGLDLEMPPALDHSELAVVAAVESGELTMEDLYACVRRVLELVARAEASTGSAIGGAGSVTVDFDAHHALAREAAAQGIVLLENDGVLPLSPQARIGVIGEFARTTRFQGGGSSQVNATRVTSALEALSETYGEVPFAPGFTLDGPDEALAREAVELARRVQVPIVCIGLTDAEESEGFDRTHMDLAPHQVDLVTQVSAVNPRTVVVLSNGSVVSMAEWKDAPAAILEAWLGGQAVGGAVADVLTGKVNPSGRLNETIPMRLEDNPSYGNFPSHEGHARYGEGIMVGYRGYDARKLDVLYPFGHGLSYTSFAWSGLRLETAGSVAGGDLAARVRLTVTNTGERAGADVVQVYVRDVASEAQRPVRELKGFTKVFLEPGESRTVELALDQRAFSFWSQVTNGWEVEAGEFVIEACRNAREVVLEQSLQVEAPRIGLPLSMSSTAAEWLADEQLMERVIARWGDDSGRPPGLFGNEEMMTLVGNFPMDRLLFFPGNPFSYAELEEVLGEVSAQSPAPAGF